MAFESVEGRGKPRFVEVTGASVSNTRSLCRRSAQVNNVSNVHRTDTISTVHYAAQFELYAVADWEPM